MALSLSSGPFENPYDAIQTTAVKNRAPRAPYVRPPPESTMAPGGFASIALARTMSTERIESRATHTRTSFATSTDYKATGRSYVTRQVSFELPVLSKTESRSAVVMVERPAKTVTVSSKESRPGPTSALPRIHSSLSMPVANVLNISALPQNSEKSEPASQKTSRPTSRRAISNPARVEEALQAAGQFTPPKLAPTGRFERILDEELKDKRRMECERAGRGVWW